MTLEEVLPEIRQFKHVTRPCLDGRVTLVKCKDNKTRLRIWRGLKINYPYRFEATDLLADDWIVLS